MSATYSRFRQQLLYAIVLVVVIPTILIINAVRLNMSFTSTLDHELQQKGIVLATSIGTFLNDYTSQPDLLQSKLNQIKTSEPSIQEITIYRLYNEKLAVFASTQADQNSTTLLDPKSVIAWDQKTATAELDPSTASSSNRIWTVSAPVLDSTNTPVALLNIHISTAEIDTMVAHNNLISLIYLAISCVIILLLLVNHFFYIGYAKQLQGVRQINRMKDAFVTSISVGLQNPIIEIKNYAAMLHRGYANTIDEQGSKLINGILTDATKLYTMITDLLEISQVDRGAVAINRQQFNPMAICQEVYEQLQMTANLKGLTLNHYVSGTQALIVADPDRFRQAFFNILNLAISHTKTGSIDINYEYDDEQNLSIVIKAYDLVFDRLTQAKIFHRPLEESDTMAEWYSDFGITYWASKRIIETMQGQLDEDSRQGMGTVFQIRFAARPIDVSENVQIHTTIAPESTVRQFDESPAGMTPSPEEPPVATPTDPQTTPPPTPPENQQPWHEPASVPVSPDAPIPSPSSENNQGFQNSPDNRFSLPPD
jgi:signal transduction histidine kinase